MRRKIGIISGSLRQGANSTKIAENIAKMLEKDYDAKIIEIKDLPFYNEDLDADGPAQVYEAYRQELDQADGFILVTPEYNRSMSAAIKNALDVGSRPYGQSKLDNKPVAIISSSPSGIGGMAANHALRQVLVFINMIPMQQPEAYLANIDESFEEDGSFTTRTEEFMQNFLDAYKDHVEMICE